MADDRGRPEILGPAARPNERLHVTGDVSQTPPSATLWKPPPRERPRLEPSQRLR